ncbi:DsrE family protein [Flavobacterium sp. HSC-61S13]|uniref:DsrE family protein n=1 Tax=Flavobacterium sp. HSC-61S13 TaxID=2910963 RepID=UPI00209E19D8|nr:DsrE family protein [Flavobacterium sp. HSC-61S13]MCP1996472.1 intracellular sulfur oxidation DsrE/DsrF family protein [Flavobacterium sp. HSC-61S13]
MKKTLIIAGIALLGFAQMTEAAVASKTNLEQTVEGKKFAILVQSVKSLRSAIMTATEIKQANPKVDFEIVIMGQMVQELATDKDLQEAFKIAEQYGVQLRVCEFAMKVYGVSMDSINPYIKGTPNAHKYMFQLQERGYNVLSI